MKKFTFNIERKNRRRWFVQLSRGEEFTYSHTTMCARDVIGYANEAGFDVVYVKDHILKMLFPLPNCGLCGKRPVDPVIFGTHRLRVYCESCTCDECAEPLERITQHVCDACQERREWEYEAQEMES